MTFTNDTVKETMRFIKELYDEGCVTLIAESYGDQTDFGNYKTLFTIGSILGPALLRPGGQERRAGRVPVGRRAAALHGWRRRAGA